MHICVLLFIRVTLNKAFVFLKVFFSFCTIIVHNKSAWDCFLWSTRDPYWRKDVITAMTIVQVGTRADIKSHQKETHSHFGIYLSLVYSPSNLQIKQCLCLAKWAIVISAGISDSGSRWKNMLLGANKEHIDQVSLTFCKEILRNKVVYTYKHVAAVCKSLRVHRGKKAILRLLIKPLVLKYQWSGLLSGNKPSIHYQ